MIREEGGGAGSDCCLPADSNLTVMELLQLPSLPAGPAQSKKAKKG